MDSRALLLVLLLMLMLCARLRLPLWGDGRHVGQAQAAGAWPMPGHSTCCCWGEVAGRVCCACCAGVRLAGA